MAVTEKLSSSKDQDLGLDITAWQHDGAPSRVGQFQLNRDSCQDLFDAEKRMKGSIINQRSSLLITESNNGHQSMITPTADDDLAKTVLTTSDKQVFIRKSVRQQDM